MKILFLDTETTGLENGRIIQLAFKERGQKDVFVEYYKPPVPIEFEAMGTHHITEKMVADKKPFSASAIYKKLPDMLAESILVAHNAPYDIGILKTEGIETKTFIDTCKVAMALYDLPNYKMQSLRYRWGIEVPDAVAHDAAGDVAVLEHVFEYMLADYMKREGVSEEVAIAAFARISTEPLLLKKIGFGKHFGKSFEELREKEIDYLEWLAKKLATDGDKNTDLIHTLSFHLKKAKEAPKGGVPF